MFNSTLSVNFAGKESPVKQSRPLSTRELQQLTLANKLKDEKAKGAILSEAEDQFIKTSDKHFNKPIERYRVAENDFSYLTEEDIKKLKI